MQPHLGLDSVVKMLSSTDPIEISESLKIRQFYQFPLHLRAEVCKILSLKGDFTWFVNSKGWFIILKSSWERDDTTC
jgi:hypothetical protein